MPALGEALMKSGCGDACSKCGKKCKKHPLKYVAFEVTMKRPGRQKQAAKSQIESATYHFTMSWTESTKRV